jgi:hypothetical protein
MRVKKPTKRIRIHTYIHTTNCDINSSLMPKQTTFMFVCYNGYWTLAHTFPFTNDKIVRDFVREYLKMNKKKQVAVRLEKHIYGAGR